MNYAEVKITPGITRGYAVDCQHCLFFRMCIDINVAQQIQALHFIDCTERPSVPISREKRREAKRRQARIERKLAC